jgi:23S rRNA (uracil1939-C5)-methyltransferase
VLQHWHDDAYIAWKNDLLRSALRRGGYADAALAPAARTGPNARQRMDLAAARVDGRVVLGLHRLRSAEVVDVALCHVLHPTLLGLIAPMRTLLSRLLAFRRQGSVVANLLDAGPDVLLRTDAAPGLDDRIAMTGFAHAHGLARIAWVQGNDDPEPIAILRTPTTILSGVTVAPPPGAFLQASASGEAAIVAAVLDALPSKGRIAELFAGCGTITFAMSRHVRVAAWEGDPAAVSALRAAANRAGLAGRIAVTQRDLARQPLQTKEFLPFAAVVLDPPFAGAAAQVAQIAAAKVPTVIYVNCNPATLARDIRPLSQSGYRLMAATPIDQFLWSTRLESVCVFTR